MSAIWCIMPYFHAPSAGRLRTARERCVESLRECGVPLLTVELSAGGPFDLEPAPSVIHLRAQSVLWQKERLINAAAARLPASCRYVAWVDADIAFHDRWWAERALTAFDQCDILQLFDRAIMLGAGGAPEGEPVAGIVAAHRGTPPAPSVRASGFAWAAKRELFTTLGLYDRCIVGGGDAVFARAALGIAQPAAIYTAAMYDDISRWEGGLRSLGLRCSFLAGSVTHFWHGPFANRQYETRQAILREHGFDPRRDLRLEGDVLEWSTADTVLKGRVEEYFHRREG